MQCSVVINTLNRATSLRSTLLALERQLHDDFEVIVVNGPSTDHTEAVLAEHAGRIKHLRCPVANLSMSRNIGIRAAAGDVVAFIDDDAIPEINWLTELEGPFVDEAVAGVGGVVFDYTGMRFQFRFGIADRFGDTELTDRRPDASMCVPGGWFFPSTLGTNVAFRRSALAEIGLFDETYEYYLDETDVALRLVDAGFLVMGVDQAPVHHRFLPSHVRNERKTVTYWYPVVKNRTYFGLRHARDHRSFSQILESAVRFAHQKLDESDSAERSGLVPSGSTERARSEVDRALVDGMELAGRVGVGPLPSEQLEPPAFLRYPTVPLSGKRYVCITSSYPPMPAAGISRFMSELAPALALTGHDVRVLTRTDDVARIDWEDGVWVHRIAADRSGLIEGVLPHVDAFATSVVDEVDRISPWLPVDAVYGPAWDLESLGIARATDLPLTVMLATPARVAAAQAGWLEDPSIAAQIRTMFELEAELFRSADRVHAISHDIRSTIESLYGDGRVVLEDSRTVVAPLGMVDRALHPRLERDDRAVTFVGRLERRKGIDVFLEALPSVLESSPDLEIRIAGSDPAAGTGRSIAEAWRRANSGAPWFERVSFLSEVDDDTLHQLYATSAVVVFPSRYESFGLVVVEAMMHGAAIVASDVGGMAEVARNGVDALLVPPGDPLMLARAITQLVHDPARRAELGAMARRRFESDFRIERAAAAVDEILDSSRSPATRRSRRPAGAR